MEYLINLISGGLGGLGVFLFTKLMEKPSFLLKARAIKNSDSDVWIFLIENVGDKAANHLCINGSYDFKKMNQKEIA